MPKNGQEDKNWTANSEARSTGKTMASPNYSRARLAGSRKPPTGSWFELPGRPTAPVCSCDWPPDSLVRPVAVAMHAANERWRQVERDMLGEEL